MSTPAPAYPPIITPDFIGEVLDARMLPVRFVHEEGLNVTFEHKGGGDVVVYLFDKDNTEIASAHVHLTGEGQ